MKFVYLIFIIVEIHSIYSKSVYHNLVRYLSLYMLIFLFDTEVIHVKN